MQLARNTVLNLRAQRCGNAKLKEDFPCVAGSENVEYTKQEIHNAFYLNRIFLGSARGPTGVGAASEV
jgi:membrane carboxypeptidase/penicillin-binding protein